MPRHFGGSSSVGRDKTRVLILLGAFCIIVFSLLAVVFLAGGGKGGEVQTVVIEKEVEIKMSDVLIPVRQIQAGESLTPELFAKEKRPAAALSDSVVRDLAEINGQFAKIAMMAQLPVHRDQVTSVRPTNILTAKIQDGYRAVTINVDARSSVEGWARPGARVDVLWATRVNNQPAVKVIVENAEVLSAERQTVTNPRDGGIVPSTVTLLVSSADAAKIQLASSTGTLSMSLRGDNDSGRGTSAGSITVDDLLGSAKSLQKKTYGNTVKIDGQEWFLEDGQLIPVPEVVKSKE